MGVKNQKIRKQKMILNLNDKNQYVVHWPISELISIPLKKMHRAIKFEPKEILKPHLEFNSEKRKSARNDFENDLDIFKFMVMIENIRNVRAQQKCSKTKNSIR